MNPWLRRLAVLGGSATVSACVMVPRTVVHHDHDCRLAARQMTVEAVQVGTIGGCAGDSCVALVAAAGVTAAASLVISGSIAIVGNVVYWLERQGTCLAGGDRNMFRSSFDPSLP